MIKLAMPNFKRQREALSGVRSHATDPDDEARMRAEREATQTAKQRGRKATKPKTFNCRCTAADLALVQVLAKRIGGSQSDVFARAIALLDKETRGAS